MKRLAQISNLRWWVVAVLVGLTTTPFFRGGRDGLGYLAVALALFIAWVFWSHTKRKQAQLPRQVVYPAGAFVGFLLLTTLPIWAENEFVAALRAMTLLSGFLFYFLVRQLGYEQKDRQNLTNIFLVGSVPIMAYGVFLYFDNIYDRAASFFYAPNAYALYLLIIWLLALSLHGKKPSRAWLIFLWLVASQFLLIQSLATLAIGLLTTIFVLVRQSFKPRQIIHTGLLLVFAAMAAFSIVQAKESFGSQNIGTPDTASEFVATKATGVGERFSYWEAASEIYVDNLAFGVGADNFQNVYPSYQQDPGLVVENPHNFYLQTFAEAGIIGGSLMVLMLVTIVLYWWRQPNHKRADSYFAALIAVFLHAGFYQTTRYPVFWLITIFLFVLWLQSYSKQKTITVSMTRGRIFAAIALLFLVPAALHYRADRFTDTGNDLYAQRRIEDSIRNLEAADQLPLSNPRNLQSLAIQNTFSGNFDVARDQATRAVEADGTGRAYGALGFVLQQTGAPQEQVIAAYEAAIERDPFNQVDTYTNYVRYLFEQGGFGRAEQLLNFILPYYDDQTLQKREGLGDLRQRVGILQFQRARLAAFKGDTKLQRSDLERTLELYPKYALAKTILDELPQVQ